MGSTNGQFNGADWDVNAQIAQVWVYPVKSCAGMRVNESLLIETGLEFDRAWMVVDDAGGFVTQREYPRMALIQPSSNSLTWFYVLPVCWACMCR